MYNGVMNHKSNCIVCGSALQGKQTMFCSLTCKNRHHQSYMAQKNRGLTRKLKLVRAAGSRCSICGYDRNLAALVFHHSGSAEKDFKLDMRSLSNRTLQSVLTELDKCVLVCQNCHAELHNPHLDLGALL
jgi:predicted nucleic acid-binding Zn ribbon protein